jgi:hypothetical protein
MQILRQLLREFWFPLILGTAWTVYNLADKPVSEWTVKAALNVFGPTFFFISWLAAQWYRVRKQQRVEDDLAKLQSGIQALQTPLLPCALFFTTKIVATDEDLKRVFENQSGFRAYGPGIPLPPPPFGPPPELFEGRLHSQSGYIDFRDGAVVAAGVYRTEHPDYNTFHAELSHSFCHFNPRSAKPAIWQNEPIFQRPAVKVEIFSGGRPRSGTVKPALLLQGKMGSASEAVAAYAIDNNVLVDFAPRTLTVSPPDASGWSLRSLERSFIRFTFEFFYMKNLSYLPSSSWPSMHNLQLIVGEGRQVLSFPLESFRDSRATEPEKPLAHGDAICPRLVLEFDLTPELFSTGVVSAE